MTFVFLGYDLHRKRPTRRILFEFQFPVVHVYNNLEMFALGRRFDLEIPTNFEECWLHPDPEFADASTLYATDLGATGMKYVVLRLIDRNAGSIILDRKLFMVVLDVDNFAANVLGCPTVRTYRIDTVVDEVRILVLKEAYVLNKNRYEKALCG